MISESKVYTPKTSMWQLITNFGSITYEI
jgi:hypothetical protein